MKTIELQIDETGRNNLKDDSSRFNTIRDSFENIADLKEYLIVRYGKIPKGKQKIYIDNKSGYPISIGFLHSFWNRDISHNSSNWYQTDWITFWEQNTERKYFNL